MTESAAAEDGPGARILVAHGAGSTASTARLLLEPLVAAAWPGERAWVGLDDRTGDVHRVAALIGDWLDVDGESSQSGSQPRIACGISLGAHAVMLAVAERIREGAPIPDGCLIALPAWTGNPDATAAITAETGRMIAKSGVPAALADIGRHIPVAARWLLPILTQDWAAYAPDQLARALLTASEGSGPTGRDLAAVTVPTAVIGARDDPLHPAGIARSWAAHLPVVFPAEVLLHAARGLDEESARHAVRAWADRVRSGSVPSAQDRG